MIYKHVFLTLEIKKNLWIREGKVKSTDYPSWLIYTHDGLENCLPRTWIIPFPRATWRNVQVKTQNWRDARKFLTTLNTCTQRLPWANTARVITDCESEHLPPMVWGTFSEGERNPWQKQIKYMACYKAVGTVKQNKAGSGAQTAEGWVTVLNRSGKDSVGKLTFALITSKQEHWGKRKWSLHGEGGDKGRRPTATGSLACWTDPGGRTRRWPFLKSWGWKGAGPDFTQLGPLTIMMHQGEARRPVRT